MEFSVRGGQAGIEFMVTLGVVLLILMLTGYIIFQRYVRTTDLEIYISGKRIADSLADNINAVSSVGDGYSIKTTLPYRMFSTQGYEVVFYRQEPTVFVHGESFTRSGMLYFSSPISTNRVSCLLDECNNLCNTSEAETCLQVNYTMNIRIADYGNLIYLTPEYNLRQGGLTANVLPFSGRNPQDDWVRISSNVTGYRSVMYLYLDEDRNVYLVFNNNASQSVRLAFNNTFSGMTVVYSNKSGELDLSRTPPGGEWIGDDADYSGGIVKFDLGGIHTCIDPDVPSSAGFVWLNRGYEEIVLDPKKEVCITYP